MQTQKTAETGWHAPAGLLVYENGICLGPADQLLSRLLGSVRAAILLSCETDSPMGKPTGVCTRKSATVIDWRILSRFAAAEVQDFSNFKQLLNRQRPKQEEEKTGTLSNPHFSDYGEKLQIQNRTRRADALGTFTGVYDLD